MSDIVSCFNTALPGKPLLRDRLIATREEQKNRRIGKNRRITLSFMRVGHTRCMVDGNFVLIKRIYRHSDIDTVTRLGDIVSCSATTNIP